MAKAIGNHIDSPEAAKFLVQQLANFERERERITFPALLAGLCNIDPRHSRLQIQKVNSYIDSKDIALALPAIQAAGIIRHKSSVPLLIERLKKGQRDIYVYIVGMNLRGCDGECGPACPVVMQLMRGLGRPNPAAPGVAWEVAAYGTLVPPLLTSLKSITGKGFLTARNYEAWWKEFGPRFEVSD